MKKKILTILISVLLAVVAIPQTIHAEGEQVIIEPSEEMIVEESLGDFLEDNGKEKKVTFTVTFYGNYEGSEYAEEVEETLYSKYVLPENNPIRIGYEFIGWYTEQRGGQQVTKKTRVYSDNNIYAHWRKVDAAVEVEKYDEDFNVYYVYYDDLLEALDYAGGIDTVYLLKDIKISENLVIDGTNLDLNHHALEVDGEIINDGVITFYEENYKLIKKIIYESVDGCYYVGEKLDVHYEGANYILPEGTFFTMYSETKPYSYEFRFALDDEIVWNNVIYPGTDLRAVYFFELGGDIQAGNKDDYADTIVETTFLTLNKDITIGGHNDNDANATLFVRAIDSTPYGSIESNGKKIILDKTGKLIVSKDIAFDDSIVVSGVDGMIVDKIETTYEDYDEIKKAYTYSLSYHHFTNEEYKIPHNYKGDLEFVTNGSYADDEDVKVYVDDALVDAEDYDLNPGSIHVTLHNDFIKTLKAGKHVITINAKGYDEVSQTFTIKSKPAPEPEHVIPKTGIDF